MSDGEPAREIEIRLSDDDRARVVARLQAACGEGRLTLDEVEERVERAYHARTEAELVPLTADLPPARSLDRPVRTTSKVMGILSGARHAGPWRPAPCTKAVAVLGACHLDLTEAEFDGDELLIRAHTVFGSVEVVVPEGTTVHLEGYAVLGAKVDRVRGSKAAAGVPAVVVDVRAVMGSVIVRSRAFPPRNR